MGTWPQLDIWSPTDVNKFVVYVPRPRLPASTFHNANPCSLFRLFALDRRPYNQLLRFASDPRYDLSPRGEDLTMLYRPLFCTSYWCEDSIFKNDYRGANNLPLRQRRHSAWLISLEGGSQGVRSLEKKASASPRNETWRLRKGWDCTTQSWIMIVFQIFHALS